MNPSDIKASQVVTPPLNAKAITPANTDLDYVTRAIYVGTTGNLAVRVVGEQGDEDVVFPAVPSGATIILVCKQIRTTGTTASNIVAMW